MTKDVAILTAARWWSQMFDRAYVPEGEVKGIRPTPHELEAFSSSLFMHIRNHVKDESEKVFDNEIGYTPGYALYVDSRLDTEILDMLWQSINPRVTTATHGQMKTGVKVYKIEEGVWDVKVKDGFQHGWQRIS